MLKILFRIFASLHIDVCGEFWYSAYQVEFGTQTGSWQHCL